MEVLVTGGAGYIGSHTVVELLKRGDKVVVVDNLSNSSSESLKRIQEITSKEVEFYQVDLRDRSTLNSLFESHTFSAVLHFAGLKAVGESVEKPLHYYGNNIESSLSLLDAMNTHGVRNLLFSSSATVYGPDVAMPVSEKSPKKAINPYGQTKLMIEQILEDTVATNQGWNITSLRYFNPIGAHESGRIGEDPGGIPNNLLPYIAQVATGNLEKVSVFGNDYDTRDGTGVRDYIHVMDLADAHLAALDNITHPDIYKAYNIGTGKNTSVLELIDAFEKASGKTIPYELKDRRKGDVAVSYADPSLAKQELGWQAWRSIQDGCDTSWLWQSQNPNGY